MSDYDRGWEDAETHFSSITGRARVLEAEIARLRAELADQAETLRVTDDCLFRAVEDAQKAEAAIARVRALRPFQVHDDPAGYVSMRAVLRALDGGE